MDPTVFDPSLTQTSSQEVKVQGDPAYVADIHEEEAYLQLLRDLIRYGHPTPDRTGIGTRSLFGRQLRFSLRQNRFPLFTTKKVFWKGIVGELLWFLSGSTDVQKLKQHGVHIWDANVAARSFESQPDDAGPIYGFQWRHAGATYQGAHADYTGQGVDQLQQVIDQIRGDPYSRRHVVCSWSPTQLPQMTLAPCHVLFQFHVRPSIDSDQPDELSLAMYQRSADVGCGVPFNVASYALLLRIVAHVCQLEPADLIIFMGDTHMYYNHVVQLREQSQRSPLPFPTLLIRDAVDQPLEAFTAQSFQLCDYLAHPAIVLPMAV